MPAKPHRSGGTPATQALTAAGLAFVPHVYVHQDTTESYGLEAASALGVEPSRVFKTLVAAVDRRLTVAVVPVDGQLDLKALASACGAKRAELAEPSAAERSSGYVLGGISPIGQRKVLPTVVDDSALGFATVYVSGGRRGFDVELAPADLVAVTDATVAPIRRRG